ncbi:hypothetical protein C1280_24915 [Gemmata obscuriglobus]|uniref:Uncharacterized protein n=1 Tax=Gemmata obscuriglobus TaxID=114 RepID=A0A2Z3HDZ0_9BACT|nr:hypothetical protein C1280_24915 [Gemmata obscuriglobus]
MVAAQVSSSFGGGRTDGGSVWLAAPTRDRPPGVAAPVPGVQLAPTRRHRGRATSDRVPVVRVVRGGSRAGRGVRRPHLPGSRAGGGRHPGVRERGRRHQP